MIYEFNHVGIFVRDLEAALTFYTELLGGEVVSRAFIPSSSTDCVYLQLASGLIELLGPHDPGPNTVFGLNHIGFMSDDLDTDYARITNAGHPPLVAPKVAGSGRGRLAFLADPNGVRVELLQRDEEFRRPEPVAGPVRAIDHVSVAADNLDAARTFYGRHLGLDPFPTRITTDGHTLERFGLGPDVVGLRHPGTSARTGSSEVGPIRHIALRVDDVDETTQALRAAGTAVAPGSPRLAETGSGRAATLIGPDGVTVELLDQTNH